MALSHAVEWNKIWYMVQMTAGEKKKHKLPKLHAHYRLQKGQTLKYFTNHLHTNMAITIKSLIKISLVTILGYHYFTFKGYFWYQLLPLICNDFKSHTSYKNYFLPEFLKHNFTQDSQDVNFILP